MINEKTTDLLVERLIRRMEKANTYFLTKIGSSIKQIRDLSPSQAQQLAQILKYGGNYEEIVKEMSKYTEMNVEDLEDIFSNYAKKDQNFYKQFYQYKDIPYTPFDENLALKTQTMALSNIAKNEMYNFSRTNVLGYTINDEFYGLRETYNKLLDTAMLNIGQGKETFDMAMKRIMEDIGGSGIKTLNYESGRNVRLDSAIRMHLKSRLRELHNENQLLIGDEIEADGVEVSVHANPADDHAEIQGRQFSLEEWAKLQAGEVAEDYNGKEVQIKHSKHGGYRPISEMNCYHYIFSIVLGVSEPEYSEEQLEEIQQENDKGFDFDEKHYTNYEGTQLQRALERKIREQKDIQILAKASGNEELISQAQKKITQLTQKYRELAQKSGLATKMDRMRVSGYRRTKIKSNSIHDNKNNKYNIWDGDTIYLSSDRTNLRKNALKELIKEKERDLLKDKQIIEERNIDINSGDRNAVLYRNTKAQINKYKEELNNLKDTSSKKITLNSLDDCKELLGYNNIKMDTKTIEDLDFNLIKENTKNLYDLSNKYPSIRDEIAKEGFVLKANYIDDYTIAETGFYEMRLNKKFYKSYNDMLNMNYNNVINNYHMFVPKQNLDKLVLTHEFGHLTSYKLKNLYETKTNKYIRIDEWHDNILDDFMNYASKKMDMSKETIARVEMSTYGKTNSAEAFAELFLSANNGKPEQIGKLFEEWLGDKINEYSK